MYTLMGLALVVRMFDASGESPAARLAAMQAASAILRTADVAATWVDCSKGSGTASHLVCTDPLAPGELVVRIARAPKVPTQKSTGAKAEVHQTLGYSMIEPAVGGTLATVFSDRVAWLASSARAKYTDLLGRAVAHEIGHLLIGANEHSSSGLMRALWTSAELGRNNDADWCFTANDRSRLHHSRETGREQIQLAGSSADLTPNES